MKTEALLYKVVEIDESDSTRKRCLKDLKELLDTNKYSAEKPNELVSTCDKDGREYRYQKRWFQTLALILYEVQTDLEISKQLADEIKMFSKNVLDWLRHHLDHHTRDTDVQQAVALIEQLINELEVECFDEEVETGIRVIDLQVQEAVKISV